MRDAQQHQMGRFLWVPYTKHKMINHEMIAIFYVHFIQPGLLGMHGFAAAVAFVEMIVAIVAAAFCCHGVCSCCRGSSNPAQQQQVVVSIIPISYTGWM